MNSIISSIILLLILVAWAAYLTYQIVKDKNGNTKKD
jgi:hypothetical protein